MPRELWTEKEVSEAYRIPMGTLRYWRSKKAVLPFFKLGALVRYDPIEVEEVVSSMRVDVAPKSSR